LPGAVTTSIRRDLFTILAKAMLTIVGGTWRQGATVMLPLAILATLFGMVLGLRFRVLVLLPAFAFGLVLITGGGLASGTGIWRIVASLVLLAGGLQFGFLGGSGLRLVMAGARLAGSREPSAVAASRLAH
jgi:hypothetical protein